MDVWAKLLGYEGNIYYAIALTLLIVARLVGILMLVPFMGGRLVPAQVKVATAMVLAFAVYPIVSGTITTTVPDMGPGFAFYLAKEVFVGVAIGFVASIIFYAVEAAGQFLDAARGASMASVLIPQLEESGPIFAQLKVQLVIVLFLAMNGHHFFLRGVFKSFVILPVDKFPAIHSNNMEMLDWFIRLTSNIFTIGLQIVVPALIAIFLVDVVLGIANRAAPQINVFFLGMPIKAYVGIIFVLLSVNYFSGLLVVQFRLMLRDLNFVMQRMVA